MCYNRLRASKYCICFDKLSQKESYAKLSTTLLITKKNCDELKYPNRNLLKDFEIRVVGHEYTLYIIYI